jgi:hypothetical protein
MGGTPCSVVTGIHAGFDWNAGTLLISTAEQLTRLSPEDVEAIRKSVSLGQSWHAYEAYKVQVAKQAVIEKRLAWLIESEALVRSFVDKDQVIRYYLHWPLTDETQVESYPTAIEAIDAMIALETPST